MAKPKSRVWVLSIHKKAGTDGKVSVRFKGPGRHQALARLLESCANQVPIVPKEPLELVTVGPKKEAE